MICKSHPLSWSRREGQAMTFLLDPAMTKARLKSALPQRRPDLERILPALVFDLGAHEALGVAGLP